uniref:Polypeptide N-acetylgalactosaminyltransferase like 5 n=1 Tax=Capra hircus TaxID=9925 RepID=A0A452F7T6_CAPHI
MRNVIIQSLLCASLTFGIWIAVFSIYLHYNHVKKQEKTQEKGNPLIWSLGEKLRSKADSVHIPRAYNVRVQRASEDEPAEPKSLLRLGVGKKRTRPDCLLPASSFVSTMKNLVPCFEHCPASWPSLHSISWKKLFW